MSTATAEAVQLNSVIEEQIDRLGGPPEDDEKDTDADADDGEGEDGADGNDSGDGSNSGGGDED